jgi:hypothetical protein
MKRIFNLTQTVTGCLFAAMLIVSFKSNAQIAINVINDLARIKSGTTYITMRDPESEIAKDYIEVYKKYWTLSKIEFIKYNEVSSHMSEESTFLTFGGFVRTSNNGTSVHLYLELWKFSEKYLNGAKRKKPTGADQIQIARIEFFPDFATIVDPNEIFKFDYDGDGHFRNWSPGLLKNYIQQLTILLEANKKRSLFAAAFDNVQLSELKKQTLYVPDYVQIKFGAFTGSESKKIEEKELFEDYKYEYKLLPMSELSNLILTNPDPIYYAVYVKSSTDKYITVFNSATGEIIYTVYKGVSYNIGGKDFKAISNKIK